MKSKGEGDYEAWLKQHKDSGMCSKNFDGSSGAMEAEAARVLWHRSEAHRMRYTSLVGDGDTKTYTSLVKAHPYGDIDIVKEECVNHVAKRLNTALRNMKSTLTKQSVKIGGRTKGSLTDAKIGLLQSYYTKAVRTHNESVEDMSKAIWAAYHHSTGNHESCPDSEDTWCWYQRDRRQGVEVPHRDPQKQSTFLSETVARHVKNVYTRLTDPALLQRCLLGKTQNCNESLHSLVWMRCPKHLWSGYQRVFIASLLGVAEFNMGSLGTRIFF